MASCPISSTFILFSSVDLSLPARGWQPVQGDISEMRVHYGPGYRLYFVRRGRVVVVMLNAGDKSSQRRGIRRALKLADELGDDL